MRIAMLERFAHRSRRCDPARVATPDDDVVVWDLSRSRDDPIPSFRDFVRVAPAWATLPLPIRRRWRLLRLCAGMRGWRRAALLRVPAWMRALRAGEIDQIACFSAREFQLAHWFAEETGRPCREMLTHGTQYFGEFAFELLAVVPYAYWLHEQGRLEFTASTRDTRCLYYFSPDHTEVDVDRVDVPITEYPVGEPGDRTFDRAAFPTALDTTRWRPPPYGDAYDDDRRFHWDKPPLVVCNKAASEEYLGSGFAVNYLDIDLLLQLMSELTPLYTVIYNRPRADDIVVDHSEIREFGDIEAVKRAFPGVVTIQELHAKHSDLTFNELQLRLFAGCEHFISVLGGASYLASYFGGTNVVYARRGWEVVCGAFENWFGLFSGARVVAAGSPDELIHAVRREMAGLGGVIDA
jgi:hypothetical protein